MSVFANNKNSALFHSRTLKDFQVLNHILCSPYNSSKIIPLHDDTQW